jgi:hypothetical protein
MLAKYMHDEANVVFKKAMDDANDACFALTQARSAYDTVLVDAKVAIEKADERVEDTFIDVLYDVPMIVEKGGSKLAFAQSLEKAEHVSKVSEKTRIKWEADVKEAKQKLDDAEMVQAAAKMHLDHSYKYLRFMWSALQVERIIEAEQAESEETDLSQEE